MREIVTCIIQGVFKFGIIQQDQGKLQKSN